MSSEPIPTPRIDWRFAAKVTAFLVVLFAVQQWITPPPVRRTDLELGTSLALQTIAWGLWLALLPLYAVSYVVLRYASTLPGAASLGGITAWLAILPMAVIAYMFIHRDVLFGPVLERERSGIEQEEPLSQPAS